MAIDELPILLATQLPVRLRPSGWLLLLTKMMPKNKQPQSHGNIRQPPGGYPQGAVSFLRALGAPDAAALVAWAVEARPDAEWAAWLRGQSLAPFVFHRLREAGVLTRLPADVQRSLQGAYYAAAGMQHSAAPGDGGGAPRPCRCGDRDRADEGHAARLYGLR